VVLWPETAYPFQWPRSRSRDPVGIESIIARGVRGPVVLGSITHARHERYNSVLAVGRDGALLGIVDKRVLMPFSERIPFYEHLTPWHAELPGSLTPAPAPGLLVVEGLRIGILNCYEDLSDEHARSLATLSPDLLSNHTNDAWFGEHGAVLHLFLSRMRAIETGRDLVRAVNGGYSAHVAWTGEIIARRGPGEPGTIVAEVRIGAGASPFVRFGDWVGAAALGAMLALLLARRA
jgi:apolipoprotein N-acyltransferase